MQVDGSRWANNAASGNSSRRLFRPNAPVYQQNNGGLGNMIVDPEEQERDEWRAVHEAVEYAEIRERNKVRIKTNINKRDVKARDFYPIDDPLERKIFKYYCPICLRYFNHILVSTCCDNYICRFCIGDMARKAKQDVKFQIMCSHCTANDYKLLDVDPDAPLRVYTDTPFKLVSSVKKSVQQSPAMLFSDGLAAREAISNSNGTDTTKSVNQN